MVKGCQKAAGGSLADAWRQPPNALTCTNTGGPREDRTRNPRIKSRLWRGTGCLVGEPKAGPTCGDAFRRLSLIGAHSRPVADQVRTG